MNLRRNCFLLLAAAVLAMPLGMIGQHEWTLRHGQAFSFPLQLVDPADPFHGRYLALSFKSPTAAIPPGVAMRYRDTAYALVYQAQNGTGTFTEIRQEPPENHPYMQVIVRGIKDGRAILRIPVDRFYLNERLAPAAEAAYRQALRKDQKEAWAVVRLWKGMAVLEDVMVDGKPLLQFAREAVAKN